MLRDLKRYRVSNLYKPAFSSLSFLIIYCKRHCGISWLFFFIEITDCGADFNSKKMKANWFAASQDAARKKNNEWNQFDGMNYFDWWQAAFFSFSFGFSVRQERCRFPAAPVNSLNLKANKTNDAGEIWVKPASLNKMKLRYQFHFLHRD